MDAKTRFQKEQVHNCTYLVEYQLERKRVQRKALLQLPKHQVSHLNFQEGKYAFQELQFLAYQRIIPQLDKKLLGLLVWVAVEIQVHITLTIPTEIRLNPS